MTVQSDLSRWTGAGNGVATSFPFTRRVLQASDLLVYLISDATGAESLQILNSHYTVSGAGSDAGGSVDFIAPPATGYTVLVRSARPYTQPSNFRNLGRFLPEIHQNAMDGLEVQIQQLKEVTDRSIRGAINGPPFGQLPSASEMLGKFVFVDSAGNTTGATGTPAQPVTHTTEIVYATEGQTVVPVSAYTPGAGNLTVKVNGVQIVLFDDYLETSSTSITLFQALNDGDVVILSIGEVFTVTLTQTGKTVFNQIAVDDQTIITVPTYRPNLDEIELFINGSLLSPPDEYTESSETTITLLDPLLSGDRIRVLIGQPYDSNVLQARSLLSGTSALATTMVETTGVISKRWRITPADTSGTGTAELELVPGLTNDGTALTSEILLYGRTGTNYERLVIANYNSEFIIDVTANNAGVIRNLNFQMGGRITPPVPGQNALVLYGDASVDLPGATYSAHGYTWGSVRTRISDRTNVGVSALIYDTRTGTPASNVADSTYSEFRRGGAAKWQVGLNVGGSNVDSFDWMLPATGVRMSLSSVGLLNTLNGYSANGSTVLRAKRTGWGVPTGAATRSTFATGSVTLPVLAEHVKALLDDLMFHGMISA
jgi:hypothetical protein